MTELLYGDAVLQSFPDNVSELIVPLNLRNYVVSAKDGLGFLSDSTPVVIPVVSGVFVDINSLLVTPSIAPGLWTFDGNNFAISNYSALPDTTITVGYKKVLSIVALLNLDKAGGGTDTYDFQFTKNGTGVGQIQTHVFDGTETLMTLLVDVLADVSLPDTYSVAVRGSGTGDDFTLSGYSMQLRDSWLMEEPVAP